MTGALVVARRELSGLFMAPFTWIVLLVVLFLRPSGLFGRREVSELKEF